MVRWIVLALPSLAQSLLVSRGDAQGDLCDAEAMYKARQAGDDWKALKGNPCMSDEIYKQLENGERDPADNHEFLGDDDADELVDVVPSPVITRTWPGNPAPTTMFPKVQFIGLPHSGSTSLAMQMNLHPELSYGYTKEHKMIFNLGKTSDAVLKKAYQSGFPLKNTSTKDITNVKYTFDASPDTMFIGCPDDQRMLKFAIGKKHGTGRKAVHAVKNFFGSDTKYIIMLRDPVDWMISDAQASHDLTLEHMLVNTSVPGSGNLDSKRSCYADCVEPWVDAVGRSNILFLQSEAYFKNPQSVLNEIFHFLKIGPRKYSPDELGASGRRRYAGAESSFKQTDRKLYWKDSHVKDCHERLSRMTKRSWHWGP